MSVLSLFDKVFAELAFGDYQSNKSLVRYKLRSGRALDEKVLKKTSEFYGCFSKTVFISMLGPLVQGLGLYPNPPIS